MSKGKGVFKKKRTRLIALLAAACAFLAVGIGAGAAAASRAATVKKEAQASKTVYPKVRTIKPADSKAVLVSDNPCDTIYTQANGYGSCRDFGVWDTFNSSAQVFNNVQSSQIYGGWAGQTFSAKVTLGAGISMPIIAPIGLWNGTEFQNPNTMTPGQIEEAMLNGDYMGAIAVAPVDSAAKYHSFLGGVSYDGQLITAMSDPKTGYLASSSGQSLLHNIGLDQKGFGYTFNPESIQYEFQNDCNNSNILNNSYFAKMASLSTAQLQSVLHELLFSQEGLYTTDEEFYSSIPDSGVETELSNLKTEGENLESPTVVKEYQAAFDAYKAAAEKYGVTSSTSHTSTAYQEAKEAYLNALGQDASKDQPLLCLAAWDQNVGYTSFPRTESLYMQGSNVSGGAFEGGTSTTYPYAFWGAGPSYQGSSDAADSTLAMTVTGVATSFLALTLGGNSNSVSQSNAGIYLMAMYNTNQTAGTYSSQGGQVTVNVKPTSSTIDNGTYLQISFRSLGQSYTDVNPTSGVTLSTSSPSSDGLYFQAVSQSGERLKSVKMELIPEGGHFFGSWGGGETPIIPATNSAPSTVDGEQIWADSGNTYWAGLYNPVAFTIQSLTSQPGWFDLSGVGEGTYDVKILGGTTEKGKQVSYGSYYQEPTFQIHAESYSSPETIAAVTDPCGFVNPSQDEVVVGAANPSSSITKGAVAPKSGTSDPWTATVGKGNPFTYQAEAYMPFDLSGQKNNSGDSASSSPLTFTLSSLPAGEKLVSGSVEVNGKSLSSLGVTPSSSSSPLKFTLSPSDISTAGSQGGTVEVTWQAYLDTSWASPGSPTYEFDYQAYSAKNSGDAAQDLDPVATDGPADDSVPSSLSVSGNSSETGLWFKDLDADGASSTGAQFSVQNSSGQYLNEDLGKGFSGWSWTSNPQDFSYNPSGNSDKGLFSFGGLPDGTYYITLTKWPEKMMDATKGAGQDESNGYNNWAGAPYPMALGTASAATDSFQVVLSYSSPEDMSSINDPAGLVDHASDSMYSLAPVEMANGSAKAASGFESFTPSSSPTETVGADNWFYEGWKGYLPFSSINPYNSSLNSGLQVSFPEADGGLGNGGNSTGLKMYNVKTSAVGAAPEASTVYIAGEPLSSIPSSDLTVTSSGGDYTISISPSGLSWLENNGYNVMGDRLSDTPGTNREIYIAFPAVMTTSFKEGGKFQQWMSLGEDASWWTQSQPWGVYSSPLYTNGPADNSLPSSLSMSSNSSETGLWFQSLWWGRNTPATGAKFTVSQVQNGKTEYLTPVKDSSGFTGWSWEDSPYDFSEQDSKAYFSFGGLATGTYTVTEVSPASGASSSKPGISFTAYLPYSSHETITSVSDPLNLLEPSKGVVYNVVLLSRLPFTGGRWVLALSGAAVLLFVAGGALFLLRKRRA